MAPSWDEGVDKAPFNSWLISGGRTMRERGLPLKAREVSWCKVNILIELGVDIHTERAYMIWSLVGGGTTYSPPYLR